jgi:hypothetical protein
MIRSILVKLLNLYKLASPIVTAYDYTIFPMQYHRKQMFFVGGGGGGDVGQSLFLSKPRRGYHVTTCNILPPRLRLGNI